MSNNREVEEATIAATLIRCTKNRERLLKEIELLKPEHFSNSRHRAVFEAFVSDRMDSLGLTEEDFDNAEPNTSFPCFIASHCNSLRVMAARK